MPEWEVGFRLPFAYKLACCSCLGVRLTPRSGAIFLRQEISLGGDSNTGGPLRSSALLSGVSELKVVENVQCRLFGAAWTKIHGKS